MSGTKETNIVRNRFCYTDGLGNKVGKKSLKAKIFIQLSTIRRQQLN